MPFSPVLAWFLLLCECVCTLMATLFKFGIVNLSKASAAEKEKFEEAEKEKIKSSR